MQKHSTEETIDQIIRRDARYPADAYQFVLEALDFTLKQQKKEKSLPDHVSVADLLEGIRAFALQQFGPLTHTVLDSWNIRACEDFGEIVFNMVTMQKLRTSEKDSKDDFKNGYDFHEAFRQPFERARRPSKRSSSKSSKLDPKNAS